MEEIKAGSIEDIEKNLNAEINPETPKAEVKEPAVAKEVKPEAGKEVSKETQKPAEDDPEFDLADIGKIKKSEIKKWKDGHLMQEDYTKKTQELAKEREEIKELKGVIDFLKANPKKAERIVAILDEKEEKLEEKKEAIAEKQDEIDEILKDLDPNDPYAKALKATKIRLEAQDKLVNQTLEASKQLQTKLEGYEKKTQTSEEENFKTQAQQVLQTTLEDTAKGFKFSDDEEKADWRERVLGYLVRNPKQSKTEEEFKTTIKEIGKKYFDVINRIGENRLKKYLQSKDGPEVPATSEKKADKPLTEKPDASNLTSIIEEALSNEQGKS